ncbi:MAG: glycoside hydrolase family 1 protein [Chloroflexi bacterium]|nr:glycoside hydrolase family 1 protein [Chloroflexota bacterium]
MNDDTLAFPKGFLWGTATSAHQVEGNNDNNDWWDWEQIPGHIRDGHRSGRACDHWNRFEEDFDLARSMGQNAHRFSLEWSRIEPREGQWSRQAIEHYRRVLAALHARDMEPLVTLHHFTNPRWLSNDGGWENPRTIDLFERYVRKVVEELGDSVRLWITLNEPTVVPTLGYLLGRWPPGVKSLRRALRVMANMIRAHGAAYRAIHQLRPEARVSVAYNMILFEPLRPSFPADRWVAQVRDYFFNRLFLFALIDGRLRFPLGRGQHLPEMRRSLDFIGLNYYYRHRMAFDPRRPGELFGRSVPPVAWEEDLPWWVGDIYPQGLYRFLLELAGLGIPIYVTENGLLERGDRLRPAYILTHLAAAYRALAAGVPVRGYFYWSLIDNFEWADGFTARFGLVHVDFSSQRRRLKKSGELYREIARANGISRQVVQRCAPELAPELFAKERQPKIIERVQV